MVRTGRETRRVSRRHSTRVCAAAPIATTAVGVVGTRQCVSAPAAARQPTAPERHGTASSPRSAPQSTLPTNHRTDGRTCARAFARATRNDLPAARHTRVLRRDVRTFGAVNLPLKRKHSQVIILLTSFESAWVSFPSKRHARSERGGPEGFPNVFGVMFQGWWGVNKIVYGKFDFTTRIVITQVFLSLNLKILGLGVGTPYTPLPRYTGPVTVPDAGFPLPQLDDQKLKK